jgi:hypothetical protein
MVAGSANAMGRPKYLLSTRIVAGYRQWQSKPTSSQNTPNSDAHAMRRAFQRTMTTTNRGTAADTQLRLHACVGTWVLATMMLLASSLLGFGIAPCTTPALFGTVGRRLGREA